jgi:hypothetical protein
LVSADPDRMIVIVDLLANCPEISRRREFSIDDDENVLGKALDF